jgi:hypothetical protein
MVFYFPELFGVVVYRKVVGLVSAEVVMFVMECSGNG